MKEILSNVEERARMVKHTFTQISKKFNRKKQGSVMLIFDGWEFSRIDKRYDSLDSKSPTIFIQEK